jgi:uncharacterized membrane protein
MLSYVLILVVIIVSFYIWWTKQDALNLRVMLICVASGLVGAWSYLSSDVLHLSGSVGVISKYAVLAFWVIGVVAMCLLLPKYIRNQKGVDDNNHS